jgi:hypothetical protein
LQPREQRIGPADRAEDTTLHLNHFERMAVVVRVSGATAILNQ